MPFSNPVDYAKDHAGFSGADDISGVGVSWGRSEQAAIEARFFVRGELFAVLWFNQRFISFGYKRCSAAWLEGFKFGQLRFNLILTSIPIIA